jgi:hypothetical protein
LLAPPATPAARCIERLYRTRRASLNVYAPDISKVYDKIRREISTTYNNRVKRGPSAPAPQDLPFVSQRSPDGPICHWIRTRQTSCAHSRSAASRRWLALPKGIETIR